jgi:hypothetical protein
MRSGDWEEDDDAEYHQRRKAPNFRNFFPNSKDANLSTNNAADWKVPSKLLIELATLSNLKFKIELMSKLQSLTLPIQRSNSNDTVAVSALDFADRLAENGTLSKQSSLEKNYITLTCLIVSKNVALVPPIRVLLPYSYPDANPFVDCKQLYDDGDDMLPGYGEFFFLLVCFLFLSWKFIE